MFKQVLSIATAITLISTGAQAAAITWGATIDNGFSRFSGAELADNSIVRIGSFDITDGVIFANKDNLTFLNSHFTLIDSARIGDGLGDANSNFARAANPDTTAVVGLQIYYWVFNSATTFDASTEHGIFYFNKNADSDWAFPVQSPVPGSSTTDISDLTDMAGTALAGANAVVVVGSFPNGASTLGVAPNFGLAQVVPEPTSIALLGFATVGLLSRRRRK